jgi:hypothetical protein
MVDTSATPSVATINWTINSSPQSMPGGSVGIAIPIPITRERRAGERGDDSYENGQPDRHPLSAG